MLTGVCLLTEQVATNDGSELNVCSMHSESASTSRAPKGDVFGVKVSPSSRAPSATTSSTASTTTAHAPTASIATVVSSLMHATTTASARLILDLLLLDHFDDLIWHSEVLDLSHVSTQDNICKLVY
jgi:hypothetical protein